MAQVVLSTIGQAVGGPVGAAIGGTVGAMLDRAAIESLRPPREVGPRLQTLHLSSAAEGAPVPAVFGRARIGGQVIWAARFKARRVERTQGGGKGGPRTVEEAYSLSFAVALGEGPIDGVGRVWADGRPMDMTGVVMRVHPGTEDQAPDPLIAAVEGEAPAYRGTAYAVFEDLPLGPYGARPPQLSFEVFRRPRAPGAEPGLEDRLHGVCLIPGAGEFVYATETVLRRESLTRTRAENVNNPEGRPDLLVSLDQLGAQLPNVREVTLVVTWFGDDLRAGVCEVRPGVEQVEKATLPSAWRVGGVDRSGARVLASAGASPSYGGTPSDTAVLQAITELKRRGYRVTLYPFLMMDVAPGNGRPDPYGGAEQAAYPWRGRITCHPAPGRAGSPDGSGAATAEVERFFGTARADEVPVVDGEVRFAGSEWSWSRAVLHYARLAELAGGVDGFLIGSELRGLTAVRDGPGAYPAVRELRRLAAECRKVLRPATALSYAADWSEWFGHQPPDGTGEVRFHLDPLWSDPAVSFVGIDWYPPGADWRDGTDHLDAQAGWGGPHDPAYLAANVAGGEGFDWFYASAADRAEQRRTPITDGAYGEPWVFRPKDIASWWAHPHHDRPGGVRAAEPTAWVPRSKPVRLVEFGCPAVDKGANSPNLFIDPKSAESALPPFSDGGRDDLGQRRALEALLAHFERPETNLASDVYGGPMVEALSAWCWDARPFPDFPGRPEVWADAPNWIVGHWLNGRTGVAPAAELIAAVLARGGVEAAELDLAEASGAVTGYVVDRPMRLREALSPLLEAFGLDAAERDGRLAVLARERPIAAELDDAALAWPEDAEAPVRRSRSTDERPGRVRVRFIDEAGEYAAAAAQASGEGAGGELDLDLPVVTGRRAAEAIARRRLGRAEAEGEEAAAQLAPEPGLRLEPGDQVRLPGGPTPWRVMRMEADETPRAALVRVEPVASHTPDAGDPWRPGPAVEPAGPPVLHLLDLPPLPRAEADTRPLAAVAGEPWRAVELLAGPSGATLSPRARATEPAAVGALLEALGPGPLHRLDEAARPAVALEGATLQSRAWLEVAAGANALAVQAVDGEWEVMQFLEAELIGPERWRLRRLLRGQAGTDGAMRAGAAAGAPVVLLDSALVRAEVGSAERGLPLVWRAGPPGSVDPLAWTESRFTWRGVHGRPWSPARLRARREPDGGVRLSWTRRARVDGDAWDGEPPLGEEAERYRTEVLDATGTVLRSWEVEASAVLYDAAEVAADWPDGPPAALAVRVRQGSAVWGWGAPAERALWL